ncbi:oligopeptide transporter ATP-binding component [compost metagenome]
MTTIAGQPPLLDALPPGCRFEPRCAQAMPLCREQLPELRESGPGHRLACHTPLLAAGLS